MYAAELAPLLLLPRQAAAADIAALVVAAGMFAGVRGDLACSCNPALCCVACKFAHGVRTVEPLPGV